MEFLRGSHVDVLHKSAIEWSVQLDCLYMRLYSCLDNRISMEGEKTPPCPQFRKKINDMNYTGFVAINCTQTRVNTRVERALIFNSSRITTYLGGAAPKGQRQQRNWRKEHYKLILLCISFQSFRWIPCTWHLWHKRSSGLCSFRIFCILTTLYLTVVPDHPQHRSPGSLTYIPFTDLITFYQ